MTAPSPEYRTIPLTRGQVSIVDAADYEWLSQWKWCAVWARSTQSFYAHRNGGILLHRVILGATPGIDVDHINHDTLDNRRVNIRLCTRSRNMLNTKTPSTNTSGFKGVCRHEHLWAAAKIIDKKKHWLGRFATPELAASAIKDFMESRGL